MSQEYIEQFTSAPTKEEVRLLPTDKLGRFCYDIVASNERIEQHSTMWSNGLRWARLLEDTLPRPGYYWIKYIDSDGDMRTKIATPRDGCFLTAIEGVYVDVSQVHGVILIDKPSAYMDVDTYDPLSDGSEEILEEIAYEKNKEEEADNARE